jgi:hypothetical protein
MKKYTLIRVNKEEVANSRVIYHYTHEHNLGLAFKEALIELWKGKKFSEDDENDIWEWNRIKGFDNQLGMDFEKESYLFFED